MAKHSYHFYSAYSYFLTSDTTAYKDLTDATNIHLNLVYFIRRIGMYLL